MSLTSLYMDLNFKQMKNLKIFKILALSFFALLFCNNLLNAQTPVAVHGQLSVDGNKLRDQNGDIYQLRGMSFFWSNWQGKFWNYETVKWLRDDWHCNVVRAAMGISPEDNSGYLGHPEIEMQKMITVIEAAIDLGIYVIVDWHSHHAENETTDAQEFFAYIAETYGHYPNILYETYNEPVTDWGTIKNYHQAVVGTIRNYDTDNVVILGTPFYSQDIEGATNSPLAGDNLCYALHYYAASHNFWGSMQTVSNRGYYVFVSEFGTCDASGNGNVDEGNSNTWWDAMDALDVSWCNWAISDVDEAASIVYPGSSIHGGWSAADLTQSGTLVRNRLRSYAQDPVPNDIAPYITSSPRDQSVPFESDAEYTVEVAGQGPMTFEWFFNDVAIANSNNATLVVENVTEELTGNYYCTITNTYGTTTSRTVSLDVRYRSTFYAEPISLPGVVQFEDYDVGGQNIGYYDASYGNTAGGYREDDVDIEAIGTSTTDFAVGFTDPGEWLAYSVNIGWAGEYTLDISYASLPGGGSFSVEIDNSEVYPETELPTTGGWTTFSTTQVTLDLPAGEHILKFNILNAGFNIDYMEFQSTTPPETPPFITIQPNNTSARIGRAATMFVSATGAQPMSYQWYHNDTEITGATTAAISIDALEEADAGDYYVVVTNHLGDTTSEVATLTVLSTAAYLGIPAEIPGIVYCKNYDEGGEGSGYHDSSVGNEAAINTGQNNHIYRDGDDVDTETCTDGGSGHAIGYIVADEWLEYSVNVLYPGTYTLGFRVASESNMGGLSLNVDGLPAVSAMPVPNTGGWAIWETVETEVELTAGGHVIRLKANQGDFNINYMEFTYSVSMFEDTRTLSNGWNLITFDNLPSNNSVSEVFNSISGLIVKTEDAYYSSSQPEYLNSLTEIEAGKGYLVYNEGTDMDITYMALGGLGVNPDFAQLPSGWNLVGIGSEDIDVNTLPSSVLVAKDFDNFYMPGSASQLTTLEVGKAYFIKID